MRIMLCLTFLLAGIVLSAEKITLVKDGKTSYNSKTDTDTEVFTQDFLDRFDEGHFPVCPTNGCYYTVTIVDSTAILVTCYNEDGSVNTTHENKE